MKIPFNLQKQYDATKNFVLEKERIFRRNIIIMLIVFLITITLAMCMIFIKAFYMIPFLFSLAASGLFISISMRVKKKIYEPKQLVEKYDETLAFLNNFEQNLKFKISDYYLNILFEYKVTALGKISIGDIFDKLLEEKYQPILDFYTDNNYSSLNKIEITNKLSEYLFK